MKNKLKIIKYKKVKFVNDTIKKDTCGGVYKNKKIKRGWDEIIESKWI